MSNFLQKSISPISGFEDLTTHPLFKGIMDSMNDGALIVDLNDKIVYANNKMCEITGYDRFELIGEIATKIFLNNGSTSKIKRRIKKRKKLLSDSYELVLTKKDKKKCWVRISGSPIVDEENNVVGSIGLHTDITLRKENEAALKKALKEKELLLQETHHRVKNNMQIVSSLMSLQAGKIKNAEEAKEAFITCQKRIKAIAILHEIIYKCDDSGKINFNSYCKKIIEELRDALGLEEQNISLSHISSIGNMEMENALTCGMLINELVFNCVEHAFTKNGGAITLLVKNHGKNTILKIKDNGKGLPSDFSLIEEDSLGLLLIEAFVEQLDGVLEVENKNGASFTVKFPS
jgi:PAS domain S-box-containing protein